MRARIRRELRVALLCLSLLGCDRPSEVDSAADLLDAYARCWRHQIVDRESGAVRLEVLGVYMPDQGALALSGTCPQGALLDWHIRDYKNDSVLKKLDSFLQSDRLGPNAAGFRANVSGHFEISTGHLTTRALVFKVAEWHSLEPVTPELSDRLWARFDKAQGPI